QRQLIEQRAIYVGVRGWIVLDEISPGSLDLDGGSRARYFQRNFEINGNGRANVHVLRVRVEARRRDRQVIRIERDIRDVEIAGAVRRSAAFESTHWIVDFYGRAGNHSAGRINDRSAYGAAIGLRGQRLRHYETA